ncbi:putative ATPase [Phycisphaera mikurensis NBRC 102666]|uniref:tRNA threonylcarbamoyladenosine biosynthesis protein TsaE n=2 Tax=Phycisphaera TaxID=666508 RepID=I0IHV7_PHYMF|nr:putative ATPase [Phycisphaera mikurensis NBRC 102666]
MELRLPDAAATADAGERLGRCLAAGDVLALEGELGAGKTTLVRGIARGLGIDPAGVSSPTFVRMTEHEPAGGADAGPWLVHVDAYRMSGPGELEELGWGGELLAVSVVAVEWASRVLGALPADRVDLRLEHAPGGGRNLSIRGVGGVADRLRSLQSGARADA